VHWPVLQCTPSACRRVQANRETHAAHGQKHTNVRPDAADVGSRYVSTIACQWTIHQALPTVQRTEAASSNYCAVSQGGSTSHSDARNVPAEGDKAAAVAGTQAPSMVRSQRNAASAYLHRRRVPDTSTHCHTLGAPHLTALSTKAKHETASPTHHNQALNMP
jgi:hypothetical protein